MGTRSLAVLLFLPACAGLAACGSGEKSRTSTTAASSSSSSQPTATGRPTGGLSAPAAGKETSTFKIPRPRVPVRAPRRPGIDDSYDEDEGATPEVENHDDDEVEQFGKPATPAQWQAAEALVRRYFAAAATEDGAGACPLLIASIGSTLGGSYERPSDPSYLHGKTCPAVMTNLFAHYHRLMVRKAKGLEVTAVRVQGPAADVLLAFKGIRARGWMGLALEGGGWKLKELTDAQYP